MGLYHRLKALSLVSVSNSVRTPIFENGSDPWLLLRPPQKTEPKYPE